MPDQNLITDTYGTAPSETALEDDLVDQGLATRNDDGSIDSRVTYDVWDPRTGEVLDSDGNHESWERNADFIVFKVGWTPNSREHAGISDEQVQALLDAGTLKNGTEVGVDISAISELHSSEPVWSTYGA